MSRKTDRSNALARPTRPTPQRYRIHIPQARSADDADVLGFEGTRAIGEPTRFAIRFTHPRHDLSRAEYLNKPATFIIEPPFDPYTMLNPEPERRIQGVITGFSQLAGSRDETTYELVLESRLALLRNSPKCRFFLDQSFPEIIERILREHGFDMILGRFEFGLYRTYERRPFTMQWHEDDLAFITRLCRRSGIWFVCEEGEHCELVRFGDDFTHYRRLSGLTVPYRAYSGLDSTRIESVDSLEVHAKAIPERYSVRAYNHRAAPEPIDASNIIRKDATTYGEVYAWGAQHVTAEQAEREALLRREAALAEQVVYHGTGNVVDLGPACVLKLSNRTVPEAKHGLLAVRVICRASRSEAYRCEFTAIPSDRLYRLPLLEHTWPKVHGTITGRIATPGKYPHPYVDDAGEYVVALHLDRDSRPAGGNSCRMRLAKPFAGPGQTGFHFGYVEGTEVTIAFHNGDPDSPYISQALHNSRDEDLIVGRGRWMSRSTIHTRSNNTLQFEDWGGEEHIKVATEHGKSQLNLGHIVGRERKQRGAGFELRTDLKGSVRAGQGLLLSADAQEKATGQQIDMDAALNQLRIALAQAEGLAEMARIAKAEIADLQAENRWLKDSVAELKQAVMVLSAPAGIAASTPDRISMAAGKDVSVATSARFNVSALRNVAIAAGEVLSLFAHKLGIKLFAARGKVLIQAQSDAMELVAQKDIRLSSADGTLVASAANGVVLSGGGSAYIKVKGDDVELGGSGNLILKVIEVLKSGPGALSMPLPTFEQATVRNDEKFILSDGLTGRPVVNRPYKIQLADGRIVEGVTNAEGETSVAKDDVAQGMELTFPIKKEF